MGTETYYTAILTAKPVILSTFQCISAIQLNTRGRVSRLSQAAPTALANPQRGNTRSHPENTSYTCSIVNLWQQFWHQRQRFQTVRDEHRRTAHPLPECPGLFQGIPEGDRKSRFREFNSPSSSYPCAVKAGFCSCMRKVLMEMPSFECDLGIISLLRSV
jgi:hypothetical protein